MSNTTISVAPGVRDRLAENKPEDMTWSDYLDAVASEDETVFVTKGSLSYSDVKEACKAAIREEGVHRLSGAEPEGVPEDADREDGEAVFDE